MKHGLRALGWGCVLALAAATHGGAAPAPMDVAEATSAFAEFLHIGVNDVELTGGPATSRPDVVFAGSARHKPPTEDPWWGPRDADGMVRCRLQIARCRDDGRPYVLEADWRPSGMRGERLVSDEDVEAVSRAFLRTYCPFFEDDLELAPPDVMPRSTGAVGHTWWRRETDTTSLRINVGMRLDDGSLTYRCWYRTGLTPAAISEEQARQIADEQWRAKYPEQELVYEDAQKLLEAPFSPTRGPVWKVRYRHGPVRDPMDVLGTQHVLVGIDAVTGEILRAPNYTPPKLTREEAQRICAEQWLAKWPDEKLELVSSVVGLDRPESPSHGPVWVLSFKRTTEGALPVSSGDRRVAVYIDGLTGEILRAPNLTKPKLSETDAEQIYQAEWVAKWPGDKLAPPTIRGFLDSSKSPTHGPVWVFAYQHNREGVYSYDVEVVMDALTGAILEGPDFSSGRPKQVKQ